jgi:integrase
MAVKPQHLGLTDVGATQIALTRDELRRLQALELEGEDETIRDLFVAACYCGIRYEDWEKLRPENVIQLSNGRAALHYFTSKGASQGKSQEVVCPLHPVALEAIRRRADRPDELTNPKVNLRIKEIARMAGITSTEKVKAEINGQVTTTSKERALLVVAHTARRTANTEMKRYGLDDDTVAALVGHARSKTMTRHYDKRDLLEIAVSACASGFFDD